MEWVAAVLRCVRLLDDAHLIHLGGAACSLPRYCADVWPRSENVVVEIDAALCELVRDSFDLPDPPRVSFRVGDARTAVHSCETGSMDAVIRDVFAGPATPAYLTTVEFYRACADVMTPGGIYVANIGDTVGLPETRAELAGMAECFSQLGAVGPEDVLAGRAYGNVVVYGSDQPLQHDELEALTSADQHLRHRGSDWVLELLASQPAPARRD